jgi:iron complex outermembrane recepter protein
MEEAMGQRSSGGQGRAAAFRLNSAAAAIAGTICFLPAVVAAQSQPEPRPSNVLPQEAPAGPHSEAVGTDADIVVTAQRREETLQQVPISISVLGGATLDKSTTSGVTDALRTVPGVATLQSYQGGGTLVTIRGVTAGQALFNGAGTVGYYLDTVPFGAIKSAIAPDASAYDLERVEVLRGPQGTLYGANALNGVVRVLTARADVSRFAVKARASGSYTENGAGNYRQDVSANVPIIQDRLAIRATAGYQRESGWIDTALGDNVNDADIWNLRLRVNAEPVDGLTLDLGGWTSRSKFGGPSTGERWNRSSTAFRQPIENGFNALNGKIAYDFGPVTLSSATSYLDYRSESVVDFTPFSVANTQLTTDLRVRVFTEEASLGSNGSGPWRWSVGGIYRSARENLVQGIPEFSFGLDNRNRSRSWAAFGEVTRSFADGAFELTGGVRHFRDTITQSRRSPVTAAPVDVPDSDARATTPRFVATWHPNDRATIYASYSQGFRSGFPQTAPAALLPPAQPDRLHNYEVGGKAAVLGGLLTFDGAVYFIDWQDVQQNVTVTVDGLPFGATINGESASGLGAEASVTLRPARGLSLAGSLSWNDLTSDGNVLTAGSLLFAEGDRLNYSPRYTASFNADYRFDVGDGMVTRLSASGYYTSAQLSRLLLGSAVIEGRTGSVFLPKASVSLEADAGWTATLFTDNLTNFRGALSPGFGNLEQYYGRARPRTFGLQLEYRYR